MRTLQNYIEDPIDEKDLFDIILSEKELREYIDSGLLDGELKLFPGDCQNGDFNGKSREISALKIIENVRFSPSSRTYYYENGIRKSIRLAKKLRRRSIRLAIKAKRSSTFD